ncbi:hypothetical protein FEM48_Zijuj05G0145200 [Ziziphus jujuba var. spinosa]|uniref:Uncharacterized protein n=1 Tax=Ziziphus jujuba var. spinosa TaxID=714518 RepID=A0A978VFD2_ZIZJJ|nr:hypothetical protein FEM48_Zijuj05G0145200 [Ziziphus jujuba var. spinosa]
MDKKCKSWNNDASLTEEGTNLLLDDLESLHNKIKLINLGTGVIQNSVGGKSTRESQSVSNPSNVRAKGCGKRIKSTKEITSTKRRLCHGCGLRGQTHDKRNCLKLLKRRGIFDTLSKEELKLDEGDPSINHRKEDDLAGKTKSPVQPVDFGTKPETVAVNPSHEATIHRTVMNRTWSGECNAQNPKPKEQESIVVDSPVSEGSPCKTHSSSDQDIGKDFGCDNFIEKGEVTRMGEENHDNQKGSVQSESSKDFLTKDLETPCFQIWFFKRIR